MHSRGSVLSASPCLRIFKPEVGIEQGISNYKMILLTVDDPVMGAGHPSTDTRITVNDYKRANDESVDSLEIMQDDFDDNTSMPTTYG